MTEFSLMQKVDLVVQEMTVLLQGDGGKIEIVQIEDGVVELKVTGLCAECQNSIAPMKRGIELMLREQVPEVQQVLFVS